MNEFDLIYQTFLAQGKGYHAANALAFIDKSIGDDAAVITPPTGQKLVICTDTLIQGRHFAGDWHRVERLAFEIGYKSVVVNLSDLAAMGATPHSILLAIALPERLARQTWLQTFAKGLFFACDNAGVALIGGDTTRSEHLVITVTAQGFAPSVVTRHSAQVGDAIYVSGSLGDAAYALQHLDSELVHRLHMPTPRIELGKGLVGKASAMIDISDGLYQDLGHILSQSDVGARLYLDKLPTSDTLTKIDVAERLQYQLTGGDDYELLFTLPQGSALPDTNTPITKIGNVVEKSLSTCPIQLLYYDNPVTPNQPFPFPQFPKLMGYQHF